MAAHLDRSGGSSEPGIARAMGHYFRRGLTVRMRRSKGNSPRGSLSGGGWGRSRVCDGRFFIATLADDEELLGSTSGFKNGTRTFPLFHSCSMAGSITPKGSGNLSLVVT
jgi:hypothetical protein